jgi:hypothetical protein
MKSPLGLGSILGLISALSFGATPLFAQTVFLDFNTPGQYTGSFNPWNDNGGANGGNYSFTESSSGGVNNGGSVSVFQNNDTTAVYNGGSWDFSTSGASIVVSAMIKANGQSSGNKVQLGILNVNNNGLNGNPGVSFESFRTIPSSGAVWSLREQYRSGNTTAPEVVLGNVTVVPGRWYKFVVSFTNTSGTSGNYDAACGIYDFGTDGQSPGTNVVTFATLQSHVGQDIATLSAVYPGIRAYQNAGIDAWDNFVVYTANSAPVMTIQLTNTVVAVGKSATFAVLADGPGPITYSWYTNGVLVPGASGATYTTPPVNSSYSSVMVNANNSNGSATSSASITTFMPSVAVISNSPAFNIHPMSATIGGQVISTGGDSPTVTLYYGPTDGGTTESAWAQKVSLGIQSGSFAQALTGLTPNTTYHFTAKAANIAGTGWASPSLSFATPQLSLAAVTNLPATNVQATLATLNGQVLNPGGDPPAITLFYGPSNGGTTPGNWAHNVSLGVQTGFFSQTVNGLSPNSAVFYSVRAINAAGTSWATPSASFTTAISNSTAPLAVAVLTQHNDLNRTGANLNETLLTTANVNTNQFGLLYSRPVDDEIHTQPLIMTNVNILGRGTHNLVIIATVNDSIYAYDADDPSVTAPYWQTNFLAPNVLPPRNTDMTGACGGNYKDFAGNMGIVGTPVIDPASGTLYVVVRTKEFGTTFVQRLHALDVATGAERPNSPVIIFATFPGGGAGSTNGITVPFDAQHQNQRPGLTLANGVVYVTWSSHCDWTPYHGWVIGYDATTLQRMGVFNDSPGGNQAGIWMSDQAPPADANGNIFISTGNGDFDGVNNFGESFLKLSPNGTNNMSVASWFTPYNWSSLNGSDADLGSGGILLIPGTSLMLSGGKAGWLYVVNRDNMGGLSGSTTADTNIVQSWSISGHSVHGGPVWWQGASGSFAYIWAASSDRLRQYQFSGGLFNTTPFAQSTTIGGSGQPGGVLSLSANGTNAGSGIVWASVNTSSSANQATVAGTLHAYNAQNITNEIWNSDMLPPRDSATMFAKFCAPTVANGKVYLPTFANRMNVYGLLPPPPLTMVRSGNSVTLYWPTNSYLNYVLQSNTNLISTNWLNVNGTVVATNNGFQVTVPASASSIFYRLKR